MTLLEGLDTQFPNGVGGFNQLPVLTRVYGDAIEKADGVTRRGPSSESEERGAFAAGEAGKEYGKMLNSETLKGNLEPAKRFARALDPTLGKRP
jgi:hypothetical protein